jgi:transposase InsO family protein
VRSADDSVDRERAGHPPKPGPPVQVVIEQWRAEYNESRPHRALGEKTPNEFAKEIAASRDFLELQTAENSP